MLFFYCIFVILSSCDPQKSSEKIRKSSLIFGGPRVSLCVSGLTANHYFWCSRVFLAVLRVLWDVPGCFGGVPGCSAGVPGCFEGVPGCSGGVLECSRCVPGFTDTLSAAPPSFQLLPNAVRIMRLTVVRQFKRTPISPWARPDFGTKSRDKTRVLSIDSPP